MPIWRAMASNDIEYVSGISKDIHPDLPERAIIFEERLWLFPQGCLVLVEGSSVFGYAISHPIRRNQPPQLNTFLKNIPDDANQYYIHDVAVIPKFRGRGYAAECVSMLLEISRPYATTCLISVYGTSTFWSQFGFYPEPVSRDTSDKLRAYGDDAVFLSRLSPSTDMTRMIKP
jgi:GNAT superfamily N-acetyltransferase